MRRVSLKQQTFPWASGKKTSQSTHERDQVWHAELLSPLFNLSTWVCVREREWEREGEGRGCGMSQWMIKYMKTVEQVLMEGGVKVHRKRLERTPTFTVSWDLSPRFTSPLITERGRGRENERENATFPFIHSRRLTSEPLMRASQMANRHPLTQQVALV